MKLKKIISSVILATVLIASSVSSYAGNPERVGSAGAQELLINPYARSSGWAGANTSNAHGLEASFLNIAGLAYTDKTEVIFSRTNWLGGSGIYINNFGFSQHIGETSVIALNIMSLSAGSIPVTTTDAPEGNGASFNPSFMNIGLSYAKRFSDNIFGGATIRVIQESIANVHAAGVSIDAGVQYHTGKYDQVHFGIALRNVGPTMSYNGDGMAFQANILNGTQYNNSVNGYTASFQNHSASFELPSLLNIGFSYDFYLTKDTAGLKKDHRITVAGNFTSNSFTNDQYILGLEYGFKKYFMVRGGYAYEKGIGTATSQTALTGPCFGATMQLPFGKTKNSSFALDYSYRTTNPFSGIQTFGFRVNL
ncbi:MAG TPA: PorV/PorQ family protein [Bacteroidia bacterium]